ncbi:MAG: YhfC family glutamic-type intramembrane protease [Anaerolineales bacterium]
MLLLSISIVIAILVTIAFPIAAGFWLKRKLGVSWRVISYGFLGYFLVQSVLSLLQNGLTNLVDTGTLSFSDEGFIILQLVLSVGLAALLGVLIRWAAMKYLKEKLDTLESAYGIGVGYGGAESILLVGLPLLMTFISMLSNMNIDPQTTTLDPAVVTQLEELWQVPFYFPLAGSLERIAAFVMHITVTILVLQVFKRNNAIWLAAAVGVEFVVNGLAVGLSQLGLAYGWIILLTVLLMMGNIYLLFQLNAVNLIIKPLENTNNEKEE